MSIANVKARLNDLLAERKTLFDTMQTTMQVTNNENPRSLTGDEQTLVNKNMDKYKELNSKKDQLETELRTLEDFDRIESLMRGTPAPTSQETRVAGQAAKSFSMEEHNHNQRKVLGSYLRRDYGNAMKLMNEYRTGPSSPYMSTQLDGGGAVILPLALFNGIIEKERQVTYWKQLCRIIPMPVARAIGVPSIEDDMAAPENQKENIAVGTTRDVLERKELMPYLRSKIVEVAESMLDPEMSAFDLESWIFDRVGYKFDLSIEGDMLNATGVNNLLGLTNLPSTRNKTVCDGTSNAFTFKNAVTILTSLRSPYRNKKSTALLVGTYLFSQMLGCVDSQNRPIWVPSTVAGVPDTLLAKQVWESEQLPATDPGNTTTPIGYFGDFNYYWMPQVNSMKLKVLDQPRANAHVVQYRFDQWVGGQFIYDEAFTKLVRGS